MPSTRILDGRPKEPYLGVGTDSVWYLGLVITQPAEGDRLVPELTWDPSVVLPRILPLIPHKAFTRAFMQSLQLQTTFIILWKTVSICHFNPDWQTT